MDYYYCFLQVDEEVFTNSSSYHLYRVVPSVKPKPEELHAENMKRNAKAAALALEAQKEFQKSAGTPATPGTTGIPGSNKRPRIVMGPHLPPGSTASSTPSLPAARRSVVTVSDATTERRALLKEIKDHIDILNEFKGIVPNETLIQRKKALFAQLPIPGTYYV